MNYELNRLFLIAGPSGVGKTSVAAALLTRGLPLERVVTCTTRDPRDKEKNNVDYHFLTQDQFRKGIKRGVFLEHADVYGNLYGTREQDVKDVWRHRKNALLVVDVQGKISIEKKIEHPQLVSIFLLPPSLRALEQRLKSRGANLAERRKRLRIAEQEIALAPTYTYQVENDSFGPCVALLRQIINHELYEKYV